MENFTACSYALVFAMMLSFSSAQQFQFSKGWTPGKRSAMPQTGVPVIPIGDNSLVEASLFTNTRLALDTEELLGLWSILKPNIVDQTMGISVLPNSEKGEFKPRMSARK